MSAPFTKNARLVLEPMHSSACWKLVDGYATDTVESGLPGTSLTGVLDTGVKGAEQAVLGEITIWGDDSGTNAKLSLQVRVPVTVTGPGKHDFEFAQDAKSDIFARQHETSRESVRFFSTMDLPDKLEGKSGLKCKNMKPAKKEDAMLADKASDKPRVMPTEWKVTFQGDAVPSKENPLEGYYVLKFPFDLEPKGKTLRSADNFDPALLPPCGARDYLTGKGLPAREYRCLIGDQSVSVATLLTEMHVKADLWSGFGKVRASNCYYYSEKYNRITHGPWVDRITLFALAERQGANRSGPDINMSDKMHMYLSAKRDGTPVPDNCEPLAKRTKTGDA